MVTNIMHRHTQIRLSLHEKCHSFFGRAYDDRGSVARYDSGDGVFPTSHSRSQIMTRVMHKHTYKILLPMIRERAAGCPGRQLKHLPVLSRLWYGQASDHIRTTRDPAQPRCEVHLYFLREDNVTRHAEDSI